MRRIACCLALTLALSSAACAADSWDSFWQSVKVDPPPPRDFLEGEFDGKTHNLTVGRLTDETVRKWVLADVRRGSGDSYAALNLRRDIADAGVFGPPGLNGTSAGIDALRARGVVRIETTGAHDLRFLAAAVVSIPAQVQKEYGQAELTDYVIVLAYRRAGTQVQIFKDGRSEPLHAVGDPNEVYWQLDTGHFVDHQTLGPLWYQQQGWSCHPNDGTITGEICGKLKL